MANDNTDHAQNDRDKTISPGTREREFYRFYQPRSYGLEFVPITATPRSSPDKALSAFCQLATFRLNCRRAQISFFDRKFQYILAEATRTSSLQDGKTESSEDALWAGITCLKRPESICSKVVEAPLMLDHDRDVTVYTIPDMSKDERVKDRPIVTKGKARFYTGVPIRSPQGHSIGAFCVLDDVPREQGPTSMELAFMKDMATVIMVHLERTRASEASIRSERMLRGLGSFVEGNYAVQDWWMQAGSREGTDGETLQEAEHWSEEQFAAQRYSDETESMMSEAVHSHTSGHTSDMLMVSDGSREKISRTSSDASVQPLAADSISAKQTSNKQQELTTDVKSTFSRAANIIRDVTITDGAIFFDASIGSFGGLVNSGPDRQKKSNNEDNSDFSHTDSGEESEASVRSTKSNGSRYDRQRREQLEKPCEVLGFATLDGCSLDGHAAAKSNDVMTEGFLRSLLQKYPNGKIFTFEPDSPPQTPAAEKAEAQASDLKPRLRKGVLYFSRRKEVALLRKTFPSARSLAIVPLFDSSKDKWYAGGIVWTTDPMRILTPELELSYLAAFGNSIMAEVHRLDVKRADTAKTKFISSVSHELRSPLHGILGSVECLQDTEIDTFQENLVHTVETCGKTLLDTIDHLLDYAKINNFTHKTRDGSTSLNQASSQGQPPEVDKKQFALDVDVDLSVITEEVMETVFAGHDFTSLRGPDHNKDRSFAASASLQQHAGKLRKASAGPSGDSKKDVLVVVDIEKAAESHWIFRTQAGAWRRIIMNLFGNALKYTDEGYIRVQLSALPLPAKQHAGKSQVTLKVSDSGRGMSEEYLQNSLFTPFAQENSLAPGTGLGLSIVKQIVQSLGGEIEVQSEKDHGTEITVTISMHHAPMSLESLEQSIIASTERKTQGLKVGFVGFEADTFDVAPNSEIRNSANARHHFMSSFHKLCKNWFDMDMHIITDHKDDDADIYLTTERGADEIRDQLISYISQSHQKSKHSKVAATPILVICDAASSAQQKIRSKKGQEGSDIAEFISQPCGPRKLAKSLALCLERLSSSADPEKPTPTPASALTDDENGSDYKNAESSNENARNKPDSNPPETDLTSKQGEDANSKSEMDKSLPDRTKQLREESSSPSMTKSKPERQAPSRTNSSTPGFTPKKSQTVLLVDDNHINLSLLVNYMKKNTHNYITATNGLEALEAYRATTTPSDTSDTSRTHFDYILMDLSMPVMDGLESTRHIRAHEREHDLPPATILALTGLASASAQQEAYSSGVDIFLTKPVSLKELTKIFDTRGTQGGAARKDSSGSASAENGRPKLDGDGKEQKEDEAKRKPDDKAKDEKLEGKTKDEGSDDTAKDKQTDDKPKNEKTDGQRMSKQPKIEEGMVPQK